jgi:hypothetical protein
MVDWIHGHSPNFGTSAEPALSPGFAQGLIFMPDITDLSYGGSAF